MSDFLRIFFTNPFRDWRSWPWRTNIAATLAAVGISYLICHAVIVIVVR